MAGQLDNKEDEEMLDAEVPTNEEIENEEDPLVMHTKNQREQKLRHRIILDPEKVKPKQISALYKIIIIGDSGIGKTSLLLRFSDNFFSENPNSTIGIDIKTKLVKIDGRYLKLQLWDTAG